jgi:hypothetical protein
MVKLLAVAAAALTLAAHADAQARGTRTVPAPGPKNVLSIQHGVAFPVLGLEYERANSATSTFGIGGFHYTQGAGKEEVKFTSGEVRLRYYPGRVALQGFSLGGAIGFASVKGTSPGFIAESQAAPTIGLMAEYQMLLGEKKNFSLAAGLGTKAVFVGKDEITSPDFRAKYPTARIAIGFAF